MDMKDENLISTIFNDKNLNKDERYMLLTLKYYDNDGDNIIKATLRELSNVFGISRISKVQLILKALVDKGYISTKKSIGKATNYSFVKESLIFKNNEDISKNNTVASTKKIYTESNNQIEPTSEKVYTESNDQIEPMLEKVCTKGNVQLVPKAEKICTKGNSQIAPMSEKVYTKGNTLIEESNKKILNESIEKTNYYENVIGIKSSEIDSLTEVYNAGSSQSDRVKDNNINNYINNNINNKLYINIFNTWNKININREAYINPKITDSINLASKVYLEEQIIQAIENYSNVYHSDHYYNHPWNLINFLSKPNGIKRFLNNGDIWLSYKNKYENEELYGADFDIEKYID